ncbi:MAG: ABC transporter permease [bacterium]|nr:ABC transporter permease [bacterium]MDT8396443.1 FtsX-like permease family protein [bacterium]
MNLTDIALLNLRRRKAKAAFLLAGLLIGVITVVALMSLVDAMRTDITDKLDKFGANILIVPKTENLSLTYGGLALGGVSFEMEEIHMSQLEKIRTITNAANVAAVGPVALGVVEVSGKKVLLSGVDFEATAILKPWWNIQGDLPAGDQVLLGSEAAKSLGLNIGDTFNANGRELTVIGALDGTGSQDDQIIFTPLATAQLMLGMEDRVSMAEVAALCKDCPIEEMVRQISEVVPGGKVMGVQSVVKGRMETLAQFRKLTLGVSSVVILVGSLVVLVTMMGSVRERTREIGIFRAIGYRRSHIIRIVLLEAALVSALAGILGYFGGLGTTIAALPFFTESVDIAVPFDPIMAGGAVVMSILLGLIASTYPALLAAKLDPNDALRAL